MKKTYLMVRESDQFIQGCMVVDDPEVGPTIVQQPAPDGFALVELVGEFTRAGHSDTEAAYLTDGAVTWVETAMLADLAVAAVEQIDGAADAARLAVSPAGRDLEYQRAEAQAQAYKDAAYTGPVPACVDSWARAKQWSARNAAIDILATADAWYGALDGIRDLRLNAKEDIRRVTGDGSAIAPLVSQFMADLSNLMKGLQ